MKNFDLEYAQRELSDYFGGGVEGTFSQYEHEKGANHTTNFKKDGHERFCKRCFAHNGCCINTGTKRKDANCNV